MGGFFNGLRNLSHIRKDLPNKAAPTRRVFPAGGPPLMAGHAVGPGSGSVCLRVALDIPLATLFDYLPPPDVDADGHRPRDPGPGPLRPRPPSGTGAGGRAPRPTRTPTGSRLSWRCWTLQPLLAPADLELIRWAADYYRHPLGEALFGALPARLRRPEPLLDPRPRGWRLTPAGQRPGSGGPAPGAAPGRGPGPAAVWAAAAPADLTGDLGDCTGALRALAAKGWVEPCLRRPDPGAGHPRPGSGAQPGAGRGPGPSPRHLRAFAPSCSTG